MDANMQQKARNCSEDQLPSVQSSVQMKRARRAMRDAGRIEIFILSAGD
jgi:hypothetical protein